MNKPAGYVCSTVSDRHQTVYSLISQPLLSQLREQKLSLHTVGRLDSLTSGLLFLTTDGIFSHSLTTPETHIPKTYLVTLQNKVTKEEQQQYITNFDKGVLLPPEKKALEYFTKPAHLEFLSDIQCVLTISEGKFHQVRRMFLSQNNLVVDLKRIAIGNFALPQTLLEGQYISLPNLPNLLL